MTLSHLWCWVLDWYTAGRHFHTLHRQPGYSLYSATWGPPLGVWTMWSSATATSTPGTWTWTLSCGSWGSSWCLATDLEDSVSKWSWDNVSIIASTMSSKVSFQMFWLILRTKPKQPSAVWHWLPISWPESSPAVSRIMICTSMYHHQSFFEWGATG